MKVSACAFDLGNTLTNDTQLQRQSLQETAAWMENSGHVSHGDDFISAYYLFNKSNQVPFLSHTYGEQIFFEDALRKLSITSIDAPALLEIYRHFLMERVTPNPEVNEALEYLRSLGIKTAILSNESTERVDAFMEKTGMGVFFDEIIVSKTVGIEKPDLQIFTLTQKKLQVPFEEILMFGDNEIADGACKRCGMVFVFVNGYKDPNWGWEKGEYYAPDYTVDFITKSSLRNLLCAIEGQKNCL